MLVFLSVRIKPSFFLPDFSTDVPVVWRLGSRLGFWDKSLNYPLEERLRPYTGSSLWPLATMPVLGGPVWEVLMVEYRGYTGIS